MLPAVTDHISDPSLVISILESHLPYSLPLLRRLQFMKLPGGRSESSHNLASFVFEPDPTTRKGEDVFTTAYLDFSRGPETELWIYSSLENPKLTCDNHESRAEEQIVQLFQRIKELEKEYCSETGVEGERETPGIILVGTLHEKIFKIVQKRGMVKEVTTPHFKFVFREEDLPSQRELPDGMEWGVVRRSDIALVLSRTKIPRKERTLQLLPSAAVRISGITDPIAWGFLGPDGSLTTLHCEEDHRGKGLAKAAALKLFHESMTMFSSDGFAHADVGTGNKASQGVCRSLGGRVEWIDYWVWMRLDGAAGKN